MPCAVFNRQPARHSGRPRRGCRKFGASPMAHQCKLARTLVVALLLLAWAAHSAQADPVTFAYSGVVNRVEPALGGLVLGAGPIGPGTPFFGHFTYDPTARPDDLTGGVLTLFTPPTHFTLTLGRFHEEGRELGFATLPFGLIDAPLPTDLAEF